MKNTRKIQTPEYMWELFEQYAAETKTRPVLVQDFVGKDGKEVKRERERPLTLEGFENWCAAAGIIQDLGDYFSNNEGSYPDFIQVCKRIRRAIRQDQIEGGMAGIYHHSITARLNNLVEKTENKHEVNEIVVKKQ